MRLIICFFPFSFVVSTFERTHSLPNSNCISKELIGSICFPSRCRVGLIHMRRMRICAAVADCRGLICTSSCSAACLLILCVGARCACRSTSSDRRMPLWDGCSGLCADVVHLRTDCGCLINQRIHVGAAWTAKARIFFRKELCMVQCTC